MSDKRLELNDNLKNRDEIVNGKIKPLRMKNQNKV